MGANFNVCRSYSGKSGRGPFLQPPILNRAKFISGSTELGEPKFGGGQVKGVNPTKLERGRNIYEGFLEGDNLKDIFKNRLRINLSLYIIDTDPKN